MFQDGQLRLASRRSGTNARSLEKAAVPRRGIECQAQGVFVDSRGELGHEHHEPVNGHNVVDGGLAKVVLGCSPFGPSIGAGVPIAKPAGVARRDVTLLLARVYD